MLWRLIGLVGCFVSSGCLDSTPVKQRPISNEQLAVMFDLAVGQVRPLPEHKAICVGLQGIGERQMRDAPVSIIRQLAIAVRLPAYPNSRCGFDVFPFVTEGNAKAMLYTVKIEKMDRNGIITFWATAIFGNLGAEGTQYQLVRSRGKWLARSTGGQVIS